MRIIIFTDSLGRPRPDLENSDKTVYRDTYGYKLINQFKNKHEIELCYLDSLDTIDAVPMSRTMVAFKEPDLVVFQLGTNDCSPRIFKKNSNSLLLKPWFRRISMDIGLRLVSKFREYLIKYIIRNKVYVQENQFRKNFKQILKDIEQYSPKCKFICLSIAMKPKFYETKSPGINNNTKLYNKILESIFKNNFIDIDNYLKTLPEDYLIYDGVHFTKKTHNEIFMVLKKRIEKIVCAE